MPKENDQQAEKNLVMQKEKWIGPVTRHVPIGTTFRYEHIDFLMTVLHQSCLWVGVIAY
jgi:hypothetical protein